MKRHDDEDEAPRFGMFLMRRRRHDIDDSGNSGAPAMALLPFITAPQQQPRPTPEHIRQQQTGGF